MTAFDELIDRNATYAAARDHASARVMPVNRVFVVTCLDPRVEPAAFLGIGAGDALVLRNPGGRLTAETIADIGLISYMGEVLAVEGEPMEVAVIHHTECGMGFLADEGFRAGFAERSGIDEADLAARSVTDPHATVLHDVEALLTSPLATDRLVVSGHVLDLGTGLVTTVAPARAPSGEGRARPDHGATVDAGT